ncbi:MAG: hypothetical protein Q9187_006897, partial [Circinaria calcarea]
MDTISSVNPETQPTTTQLDANIAHIRSQIHQLSRRRSVLTAALLSRPSTLNFLNRANSADVPSPHTTALSKLIQSQRQQNEQNTYRLATGATLFESHDPDPHAPDSGRAIGVRIEVFDRSSRTFGKPHYLLLNRPYPSSSALRVHRHTIPPCIPLPALAARYLPSPPSTSSVGDEDADVEVLKTRKARKQDLPRLVRELRREIISYQRRQEIVRKLREEFTVGATERSELKDVKATDAEVTDIRIDWRDGKVGRIRMSKTGQVEKVLVIGEDGQRDRATERKIEVGGRIEDV